MTIFLFVTDARDLPAFSDAVIRLKPEAAVQSNPVLLKDIADLQGSDPVQVRELGQTTIGPAPEFGTVEILSRAQILELLRKSGGQPNTALTGAAAVRIRLKGRAADPDEVARLLKAYLSEKLSWKPSVVEVGSISGLEGVELPLGSLELSFSSDPTLPGRGKILVPLHAIKDGKTVRSFYVTAEISIRATVQTASRKIPFDKVISADDLKETTVEIQDLRPTYALTPEELVGKASRRTFSPGEPLPLESFAAPVLVRHGETVRLRLERNGVVLTSLARAEQDGRLGQTIMVRNMDFSTILKAQVTGRAAVQIP